MVKNFKIYLVETNGLPNLSNGATPDIKSLDYGIWASQLFDGLHIKKAFIAGASFGALICMKLAITNAVSIKAAFLLNAGCLQSFSLQPKNLYYNLLPIIMPGKKNVLKFLNKAIFCKPQHQVSPEAENMLIAYEVFAIKRYKDRTEKPYYMHDELSRPSADIYLLHGDKDILFPYKKSIANAKKYIQNIKEIKVFPNVGHGIETYPDALKYIRDVIKSID